MLKFPNDLKSARILVSNDDSIHAKGIRVLEEIVDSLCDTVHVVAPENQQSAVGHSLTIHMPIRIKKYDEKHTAVYGTPTDAVLVGARRVMPERPTLVVSGINHGQNTADDVTYSGTIAAAIEAVLMGIPAIAFSQDYDEHGGKPDWDIARTYIPKVLQALQGKAWSKHTVINVNIPRIVDGVTPEIRVVPQGHFSMEKQEMITGQDPRGKPYFWVGAAPERDVEDQTYDVGSLRSGHITVTPLTLNLTDHPTMEILEDAFS